MLNRTASDIAAGDWVDRHIPLPARPYLRLARLDRPIGIWLLMYPCWWGTALASPNWPDLWFLLLFAVGATVMRAAGCTVNDLVDRDVDARVARTANRPIASGAITVRHAFVFLAALLFLGLLVLVQFNSTTIFVGAASLVLVAVYPFAKRVTYWPQAVLGLTFNWGVLLGWSAVTGQIGVPALLLYAAGVSWTLAYDTIYAHQDKADDMIVGVRSTALKFGDDSRAWLGGFFSLTVALLAASGWLVSLGWPYYCVLAVVAAHLAWQTITVDLDDPKDCLAKFRSNRHVGLIIFAGIVIGQLSA
ncbi:MAG: 4-hydroxybenzoate octaprenyltransferase [Hyphomicrobiales bacterium]|nr:4-hydroxybenzoate octaprenyltransferase [Hyphomicrobiales bacterium]